jgi:peroxiredoxin Q/BCP
MKPHLLAALALSTLAHLACGSSPPPEAATAAPAPAPAPTPAPAPAPTSAPAPTPSSAPSAAPTPGADALLGQPAPDFTATAQDGTSVHVGALSGKTVVVYFYPKDETAGCTKEACAFRDNLPRFKASKAAVLGVSILDEASKAKFADKYDLTFPLLADEDHAAAEKYGVWQKKSLYGRSFMGIVRTTYLIDAAGKVARRWDNVKVDGHAEEVMSAVSEL